MWVAIVLFAALFAGGAAINAHNKQETERLKQEVHNLKASKESLIKTLDGVEIGNLKKGHYNE